MPFLTFLHRVVNRENLTAEDAGAAMEEILSGEATTPQIAAFLIALKMKEETPDELVGLATAMRRHAIAVRPNLPRGEPLLDTCGTGGDGRNTFNISTTVAFVVAGAGVKVAKHGNRSATSRCGSADILEGLGVDINLSPEHVAESIRSVGIGFLFAPAIHPAMRFAQPARVELKCRTVFNLLGPLTNPASATVQLVGSPTVRAAELLAHALATLGLKRGFVVHGADGLDEITTTSETLALEIRQGAIAHHALRPEDFGLPMARLADLEGGDCQTNCDISAAILSGSLGPKRDIVLANTSAALVAAGKVSGFREGVEMAAHSIDSGAAREKLEQLVAFSKKIPVGVS